MSPPRPPLSGALALFPVDAVEGEAVTWLAAGDGFVTVSEGAGASITRVRCPGGP